MSTLKVNTILNAAGTGTPAIDGLAKAWVNFNGTGTVAIRAAFNVSSITDNGTGDYTASFTTALPDANYAISGNAKYTTATNYHIVSIGTSSGTVPPTASDCRVTTKTGANGTNQDCDIVTLAFHK